MSIAPVQHALIQPVVQPQLGNPLVSKYPDVVVPTPAPSTAIVVSGQLTQAVDTLYARMDTLPVITDQTTFDHVRALVKDAATLKRHVEASRQVAKRPHLDIGKTIDDAAKPFIERLDLLISEGKNQERQFLINEEQKRLAAEAARAAAEAAALRDQSRPTAPLVPVVMTQQITAPLQTRPEVFITNEAAIPREYLIVDMVRLRADALAGKVIPGVEVRKIVDVVAR